MSLPVWERGLKSFVVTIPTYAEFVAPGMGAWIEISTQLVRRGLGGSVAPGMGAWIEILALAGEYQ